MKKMLLVSAISGSLMIITGVANAATTITMPGSACVAEKGANKGVIGSHGQYLWTDTTQSMRIHCPFKSNTKYKTSPKLTFWVYNTSRGALTCTVKSLLSRQGGLQSGGYTRSNKKVGFGYAKLQVTGTLLVNQTFAHIGYCDLPAARGTHQGAASGIINVTHIN